MTKQLLLLGAALAHVNLLAHLGQHPLPGVQVTLVTPHPRLISKDMLAGFVAGQYALDDCVIPLEPLVRQSGVRWRATRAVALDAPARAVLLDDGSELHFDCLSINNEPLQDRVDPSNAPSHTKGGRKSQYPIFGSTTGRIAALLLACVARHPALRAPCTASRQRTQKRYIDYSASLKLLSCGDGHAIASWDGYGAKGRWVGWLKSSMDRRLIAKYRGT